MTRRTYRTRGRTAIAAHGISRLTANACPQLPFLTSTRASFGAVVPRNRPSASSGTRGHRVSSVLVQRKAAMRDDQRWKQ